MMEEQLRIVSTAPPLQGSGLQQTLGFLRAIEASLGRVGKAMSGVGAPMDVDVIRRRVQSLGKDLKIGKLAEMFDIFDPAVVERGLNRYARALKQGGHTLGQAIRGFQTQKGMMPGGEFYGPKQAMDAMRFITAEARRLEARGRQMLFGAAAAGQAPAAGQVAAAGAQLAAGAPVVMKIRGDQIVAELVTPPLVKLLVPGSAIQATGTGGGGGGGKSGSGGGSGGGGGGGGGGGAPGGPMPGGPNVTVVSTRTTPDGDVYRTVTQALSPVRSKTTREVSGGLSVTETERKAKEVLDRLNAVIQEQRQAQRLVRERLRGIRNPALLARERGLAAGRSADAIEAALGGGLGNALRETGQEAALQSAVRRVGDLRAVAGGQGKLSAVEQARRDSQASQLRRQRAEEREERQRRDDVERASRDNRAARLRRQRSEERDERQRRDDVERASRDNRAADLRRRRREQREERQQNQTYQTLQDEIGQRRRNLRRRVRGINPENGQDLYDAAMDYRRLADDISRATSGGSGSRLGRAQRARLMQASEEAAEQAQRLLNRMPVPPRIPARRPDPFSANQWLRNALKVGFWSTAAVPIYGALGGTWALGADAGQRMIQRSYQTARLSQVFRGDGGTARQLTADVLALAAAEGKAADQAMESAISWSRLGLSRKQVAEAVRVSLQAANVAELDAADSTKQLQAVMMAYGMRVDQLAGFVGKINAVSNTLNVTPADLFAGVGKSASVAQQMGMPVEMLIGMLGSGASAGQTGAQMGNAIKTFLVRLMDPVRQERLSKDLGIEVRTKSGLKPADQIFADMAARWKEMTGQQRGLLQQIVAGATQGNRLAIALDNFEVASVQAINAGLNLASAEREDARIKAEAANRITALGSAWDGFLFQLDETTQATGILSNALQGMGTLMSLTGKALPFLAPTVGNNNQKALIRLLGGGPMGIVPEIGRQYGLMKDFLSGRMSYSQFSSESNYFARNQGEAATRTAISELERGRERAKALQRAADLLQASAASAPNSGRSKLLIDRLGQLDPAVIGSNRDAFKKALVEALGQGNWKETVTGYAQQAQQKADAARRDSEGWAQGRRMVIDKELEGLPAGSQRRKELETEIAQLMDKQGRLAEDAVYDREQVEAAEERIKVILDQVSERYRGIMALGGQRIEIQKQMVEAEVAALAADIQRETVVSRRVRMMEQMGKLQDRLAAFDDPRVRGDDALARSATVAAEIARAEAEARVRGDTEISRLESRQRVLENMLDLKRQERDAATEAIDRENAMVQVLTLQQDLEANRLDLIRQRAAALREEREYQRSGLTASTSDIIRRAIASRMDPQAMAPGVFFGLSPEMRTTILEEQRAAERRRFLGQPLNLKDQQEKFLGPEAYKDAAMAAASAAAELRALSANASAATSALQNLAVASQNAAASMPVGSGASKPVTSGPPAVAQNPGMYESMIRRTHGL